MMVVINVNIKINSTFHRANAVGLVFNSNPPPLLVPDLISSDWPI